MTLPKWYEWLWLLVAVIFFAGSVERILHGEALGALVFFFLSLLFTVIGFIRTDNNFGNSFKVAMSFKNIIITIVLLVSILLSAGIWLIDDITPAFVLKTFLSIVFVVLGVGVASEIHKAYK